MTREKVFSILRISLLCLPCAEAIGNAEYPEGYAYEHSDGTITFIEPQNGHTDLVPNTKPFDFSGITSAQNPEDNTPDGWMNYDPIDFTSPYEPAQELPDFDAAGDEESEKEAADVEAPPVVVKSTGGPQSSYQSKVTIRRKKVVEEEAQEEEETESSIKFKVTIKKKDEEDDADTDPELILAQIQSEQEQDTPVDWLSLPVTTPSKVLKSHDNLLHVYGCKGHLGSDCHPGHKRQRGLLRGTRKSLGTAKQDAS